MSTADSRSHKQAFANYVVEQMAGFAPVQAKAMFGGFGIYRDGVMFGLIVADQLYFKVDDQSKQLFVDRGLPPFQYEAKGKVSSLKYYQAPAETYDDAEAMAQWAHVAYDCALRQKAQSTAKKPPQSGKVRPVAKTAISEQANAGSVSVGLADLTNLGTKSQAMLAKAGIKTAQDLKRLGAVMAYAKTKAACPKASLNLLWALEGALSGRPWQQVAETDRASLLMALEDVQRHWVE